jgi:hypothetical protein
MIGGSTDDLIERKVCVREERIDRIATREEMISKKKRRQCKQGSKGASNACGREEEKIEVSIRHDSKKPRMSDVQ